VDKLLQNELFTRVLALALAILVYVQVVAQNGGGVLRTVPGVPVQVVGLPQGLSVAQISPPTVSVAVSGQTQTIIGLVPSILLGTVNLANATAGTGRYYVLVNVPQGVQSVKTTPPYVTVTLDPLKTLQVPVQVTLKGVIAPGFGVGTPQVQSPNKVVVLLGPETAIAQVVQTVATVSVQSARAPVTVQVVPLPVDKNGKPVSGVTVAPSEVTVVVPVAPLPSGSQATVVPKVSGTPANGYTVTAVTAVPSTVSVDGPGGVPANVQSVGTEPVSVAGATATVHAVEPVVLPQGATGSQPPSVQVTATIARAG